MAREVLGRADELVAIDGFLDAVDDGTAALVFEGERGIGKTTLLRATVAAATDRGARVLSCSGREDVPTCAYPALAAVLAGVETGAIVELPAPQRRALDTALARGAPDADPRAVATSVLSLLEDLAADATVIVAIDDLHALDAPSARVVGFCARRLTGRVGLVVARPASGPGAELRLVRPERMEVRRLAPLDAGALQALVRQDVGTVVARRTLERIHAASGGNPRSALELAGALPPGGAPLPALPLPPGLRDQVEACLEGVDADLDHVLLAVAALTEPTVELLARALGPGAQAVVDRAEDRGLLERDGRWLRFTDLLLASGAYARASGAQRRAMHLRLSVVVPDVEERAWHLAHGRAHPDVVPALDQAARVACARGAPGAAAELLELALTLGGGSRRRLQAARCHFDAGDASRAQALLEDAATLPAGRPRAEALLLLAEIRHNHGHGCPETTLRLLDQAAAQAPADARLRAMIDLARALVLWGLGSAEAAEAAAQSALAGAEAVGDDALHAQALALKATVDVALGRELDHAPLERAVELDGR